MAKNIESLNFPSYQVMSNLEIILQIIIKATLSFISVLPSKVYIDCSLYFATMPTSKATF